MDSSDSEPTEFEAYGETFRPISSVYIPKKVLGKGTYGVVVAAVNRLTGESVAIKKVACMCLTKVDGKHTLREIRLMRWLGRHPNIARLLDVHVSVEDDTVDIIMELMDTDMHRVIRSQSLTEEHIKRFMYQLLSGLHYAHTHGVIHRDLKPANLLLRKNCDLVITDFGLARQMPGMSDPAVPPASGPVIARQMSEHVVTRWYRAPELMPFPESNYTAAIDIWSVGCILAELLGRKPLFVGANARETIFNIARVLGTRPSADFAFLEDDAEAFLAYPEAAASKVDHYGAPVAAAAPLPGDVFIGGIAHRPGEPWLTLYPHASDSARDLLDRLLQWSPTSRIAVAEALAHPFFDDVRFLPEYSLPAPPPLPFGDGGFDFSFEDATSTLDVDDFRRLIVEEVESFHRDRAGCAIDGLR